MRRFSTGNIGMWVVALLWSASGLALSAQQVYQNEKDSIYTLYSLNSDSQKVKARGSAVAVSRTILATNCHVALAGDYLVIQLHDGRKQKQTGRVFYKNEEQDVCLLEISNANFKPVKMRPTSQVKIGEVVYAIGNPKGTEKSISQGIISNKHKIKGGVWLQTDASLYFGSSGGGLFDEEGNLIGITARMGGNFGFALPTEWINAALTSASSKRVAVTTEIRINPKAVQGLSSLGSYGSDQIGLYRNNQECFLLIPGHDTNGNIASVALWNPKYENTLVAFPTVDTAKSAMNVIYMAIAEKETTKQSAYRSNSILYIAGQPYPLFGTKTNGKKYAFLVTQFSQSLKPSFLNGRAFRIVFKDDDPNIGNAIMVYQLNGIAEALSAYNVKCY